MPVEVSPQQRAADLLLLALTAPAQAQAQARDLLAGVSDPWLQSVARHAVGIVLRDRGDTTAAIRELRAALRLAAHSGDPDRTADVRATLGIALAMSGRTRAGLGELDRAAAEASSTSLAATVWMRRGYVLSAIVGRHREAISDLQRALTGAEGRRRPAVGGEDPQQPRLVLPRRRAGGECRAGRRRGGAPAAAEGQAVEAAIALHNQAGAAYIRGGDLPRALRAARRSTQPSATRTSASMRWSWPWIGPTCCSPPAWHPRRPQSCRLASTEVGSRTCARPTCTCVAPTP